MSTFLANLLTGVAVALIEGLIVHLAKNAFTRVYGARAAA